METIESSLLESYVRSVHVTSLDELLRGIPGAYNFVCHDDFAFLVGLIADQSVRVETAWSLPLRLASRVSQFSPESLATHDVHDLHKILAIRPALHRFPGLMAKRIVLAAQRTVSAYNGSARAIWSSTHDAKAIAQRLLEFDGIGPKKAFLGIQLLLRAQKISISNLADADLAVDVHVRRTLQRYWGLGGCSDEVLIGMAREQFSDFPGQLTSSSWSIGRDWCRPRSPKCDECPIQQECHYARSREKSS